MEAWELSNTYSSIRKNSVDHLIIYETAATLANVNRQFDIEQFISDFNGTAGATSFKKDLQDSQYYRINRFPSLVIKSLDGKTIILSGFRPFEQLKKEVIGAYLEVG